MLRSGLFGRWSMTDSIATSTAFTAFVWEKQKYADQIIHNSIKFDKILQHHCLKYRPNPMTEASSQMALDTPLTWTGPMSGICCISPNISQGKDF